MRKALLVLLAACGGGAGTVAPPDAPPAPVCGDGVAAGNEDCDGKDLRGKTCVSLGFTAGALACTTSCLYDDRACVTGPTCGGATCAMPACADDPACAVCGDGKVTGAEQCDDGNTVAGDCCDACRAEPGCEIERNDTLATAMPLALSAGAAAVRGRIGAAGDVDFYAIAVPAGSTATVVAETHAFDAGAACADVTDTLVAILDDGGAIVAVDDDSGDGLCSLAQQAGLPPGRAYVRVSASPFALQPTFGYSLGVTVTLAPCGDGKLQPGEECDDGNTASGDGCSSACRLEDKPEVEPDDTLATARGPYAPPFAIAGSIDPPQADNYDSDWFAMDLAAGARLQITATAVGVADCDNLDVEVSVHDAGGALLAAGVAGAEGSDTCSAITATPALAAGRSYVEVRSRPSPGHYRLVVTIAH